MDAPHSHPMARALPITTDCYSERVEELKQQLAHLQHHIKEGGHSEAMDDLLTQQIRSLSASLWALHAELEQD